MIEREKLIRMVHAVQNGDSEAFSQMYETFYGDVYYFILKTVKDSTLAEDLTQNTFLEILQTIPNLKEPAAFVSWSRKIAYHQCTGFFKKNREITVDEDDDGYSMFDALENENEEFIPGEALDKEDLKKTIHEIIDSLPEEQRSAIVLQYFDELSVKEIAQIQGVAEGTVKSRLNYARKAIKQSVETYEKKHNIKLHCAGVIPLLLWLFKEVHAANTITATAGGAATILSVADTMSAATSAASSVAKEGIAAGVKAGAKAAGKFAAKKVVAGVVAASVVAGGAATAVVLSTPAEPEAPTSMVWTGYGELFHYTNRRFELQVEKMNDEEISGHINVSYLYEGEHASEFSGKGEKEDGVVVYDVVFDDPLIAGFGFIEQEYETIQLQYDADTDEMSMEDFYDVTMDRETGKESELLAENAVWAGDGEDSACAPHYDDHRFEVQIEELREDAITGRLIVTHSGKTEHASLFTGRGFKENGKHYYEIKLETPRVVENIITIDIGSLWLIYDPQADTFATGELIGHYNSVMTRQK